MWSINYLECASPFHTPGLHSILDSFFFLSKKKRPKEVPGSGKSFHGPENNQNQRMSSVEILTKKILEDMQQSEIIVNYLADKYDNEPEKKVLSFLKN